MNTIERTYSVNSLCKHYIVCGGSQKSDQCMWWTYAVKQIFCALPLLGFKGLLEIYEAVC